MDKRLMHYQFPHQDPTLECAMLDLHRTVAAVLTDTAEEAIVQAVKEAARAENVTDLYLLDRKFIMDAIREKRERENPKPLTIEELRQMHGEPVWIADISAWGIVSVDDAGSWKGRPFVNGEQTPWGAVKFSWDVENHHLVCYRHKPKEVQE